MRLDTGDKGGVGGGVGGPSVSQRLFMLVLQVGFEVVLGPDGEGDGIEPQLVKHRVSDLGRDLDRALPESLGKYSAWELQGGWQPYCVLQLSE